MSVPKVHYMCNFQNQKKKNNNFSKSPGFKSSFLPLDGLVLSSPELDQLLHAL